MKTRILLFLMTSLFMGLIGQNQFELMGQSDFVNDRAVVLSDSGYINTNVQLDHQGSFSWFCEVNTTSSYLYGYIISSYRVDGDPYCRIQMRSNGLIRAYFNFGGGAVSLNSVTPVNDGLDHWIGIVANRIDNYFTIWIDGNPEASVVIAPEQNRAMNPNISFCIGTKNMYQLYTFKGMIDEVQIYDGNLTGNNINDIMTGDPRYIRGDILTAWWRFNEQARTETKDEISGTVGNLINNVIWVQE